MGVLANNPKVYDLVASSVQVEKIATGFTFTEGPIWHPDGYLLFSDMPMDIRRRWTEDGGVRRGHEPGEQVQRHDARRRSEPDRLRALARATSSARRSTRTEPRRAARSSPRHYEGKELNSPNDVVVKSDGSIYFSDPTYGRMEVYGQPREQDMDYQGVFRIPAGGGDLQRVADDFTQPNGLCFSPDESTLYVNDSGVLHIRRFSVNADGHALRRRGDPRRDRLAGGFRRRNLRRDEV